MNMIGLPACPRGNAASFKIFLRNYGDDLSGTEFAFIANRDLSGRIHPPVFIRWRYQEYSEIESADALADVVEIEPEPETETEEEGEPAEEEVATEAKPGFNYKYKQRPHYTYLIIPSGVTAVLEPGGYYFNINMKFARRENYIKTILAGTWPILPVPGLMWAPYHYDYGTQWSSPGWRPQLHDYFPPRVPRRFYAY